MSMMKDVLSATALFDLLDSKGICSAAIFFEKPAYATWRNPRRKKGHQLDHVLIPRKDLSRVSDAGVSTLTVESHHDLLQIMLRIGRNLSRQSATKASFVNLGLPRDPIIANNFRKTVLKHLGDTPVKQE